MKILHEDEDEIVVELAPNAMEYLMEMAEYVFKVQVEHGIKVSLVVRLSHTKGVTLGFGGNLSHEEAAKIQRKEKTKYGDDVEVDIHRVSGSDTVN